MSTELTAYEKGIDALLHYSSKIWQVRAITIGQPIFVFSAFITSNFEGHTGLLLGLFSLILAYFLFVAHNNYLNDFERYMDSLKEIEDLNKNEKMKLTLPITHYHKHHKESSKTFNIKLIRCGIFFFAFLSYILLSILSILVINELVELPSIND